MQNEPFNAFCPSDSDGVFAEHYLTIPLKLYRTSLEDLEINFPSLPFYDEHFNPNTRHDSPEF